MPATNSPAIAPITAAALLACALATPGCGRAGPGAASPTPAAMASPDQIEAILTAAQVAIGEGNAARAEAVLAEAVRTYPADHALRMALGDHLAALRRYDEAYRQYAEALAIGPRSPAALFQAGMTARLTGDHERGLELLTEAERASPGDEEIAMQAGLALMDAGRLEAAQVSLLRAAALDDGLAVVWGSLAEIALRRNEPSVALEHARRARSITPGSLAYRVLEARALKRNADPQAALALLAELAPPERFEPGVLATVGECAGLLGRPRDAADWYAQASDAFPADPDLAHDAALWAERAGLADQARELAQRAVRFGSKDARDLLTRLTPQP